MNISASSNSRRAVLAAALVFVASIARAGEWTEPKPSLYRGDIIVTYRAKLAGDWLIVEAKHAPEWHTYAMDNLRRAQEASGDESPEVEAATQITVTGGLRIAGPWKQSPPEDLSNREINWFTWGFSNTARFAAPVERIGDEPAAITVNAQACSDALCGFVRDLAIELPTNDAGSAAEAATLLEDLVEVPAQESAG